MTNKEIKQLDHISSKEIIQDIKDTLKERNDFDDEIEILMRNRVTNRVKIYMLEGKIFQRQEFINKLNNILNHRKN